MKKQLIPTLKEDGLYYFSEEVNLGIVNGSVPSYAIIYSVWNKDLSLVSIKVQYDDFTPCFVNKESGFENEFHYNRAKLAINRHLKALKVFLGAEKPKEVKKKDFITTGYFPFDSLHFETLPLTQAGKPNLRELGRYINSIVEETPRLREIAEEYNEKLREFITYRDQVWDVIFKTNKE
ncbi:MAG: hypothetical protein WC346_18820 [Methanogenium sp.]|jgi:hypothetical protein